MTERDSLINDLTSGPLTRQILVFSAPLVLANLLQTLYNLVDLAIVGQFVGSVGLSAVSISGQITFLLYALGIGLGSGAQILVAQQVGSGDREGVRRTTATTIVFTAILAAAVTAVGLCFHQLALRLLNTPAEAWQDAVDYMFWCCLGIPFTYGCGSLCCLLRGMGDSKRPMLFIGVSALANVVLDLWFVAGLGLRAKGAAMATSLAQLLGCAAALLYLYRHRESYGFDFKPASFRMDRVTLGTIVKLAAPLAFQSISINVSMLFVNAWVNVYGVVASAVSGVGSKLYSIMTVFSNAMSSAVSTFTGQNMAAGKPARVRRCVWIATWLCLVFWVCMTLVSLLAPRAVFGIFTTDAAVLDMAPRYMSIMIVMYLAFALMVQPLGLINGIGFVSLNFIIAVADGVVARLGLSLLLARACGMGLYGYWWGSALAGLVSVIAGWAYYFFGHWESRRLLASR